MNPLALCHFTLIEAEPPAFVDIAAQAGFAAVSLLENSYVNGETIRLDGAIRMPPR